MMFKIDCRPRCEIRGGVGGQTHQEAIFGTPIRIGYSPIEICRYGESMGQRGSLGNAYAIVLRTAEFLWQEGHTTLQRGGLEETKLTIFMPILRRTLWPSQSFKVLNQKVRLQGRGETIVLRP